MMKKLLILLSLFSLSSCISVKKDSSSASNSSNTSNINSSSTNQNFNDIKLEIYSVNDLHGAINTSISNNIAITGEYLINQKKNNPYSLVLANGDMFQGTAISNYFRGLPVIEWMNYIGFDSMTFGNHEFDWGIEEITKYKDGDSENGEANFNMLGANIFLKSTNEKVDWAGAYDTFDLNGIKVGVIGVIGQLESSIAVSRVAPYKFVNVVNTVAKYAEVLRTEEEVDVVIANIHDYNTADNNLIANLTGNQKIDAIITGHLHTFVNSRINGVPIVQAGSSNRAVGKITLNINSNKVITNAKAEYVNVDSNMAQQNENIKSDILDYYQELTAPIFEQPLAEAGELADKYDIGVWAADVMKKYTGADIAMVNTGGIRSGFPVFKNEKINYARIIDFSPFDNYVKWGQYSGQQLQTLLGFIQNNCNYYYYSLNDYCTNINNQPIDLGKTYKIATVDYVFDGFSQFNSVSIQEDTAVLLSALMKEDLMLSATLNSGKWYPTQGAVIDDSIDFSIESAMINSFILNNYYIKEEEKVYE